jgi:hypothetical protein
LILLLIKIDQVLRTGGYKVYSPECVEALKERVAALEDAIKADDEM